MSKLVGGNIPKHTECPFMSKCPEWENGYCAHLGVQHTIDFSCGLARLIDMIEIGEARKQNET